MRTKTKSYFCGSEGWTIATVIDDQSDTLVDPVWFGGGDPLENIPTVPKKHRRPDPDLTPPPIW